MTEVTVIVVGAGPSGIATSASLNLLSIPNIILEREDCIASLWNKKSYDRLHLHLAKQSCELPHMSFPEKYPKYVPRKEFVQYLDDYVSHFNIDTKLHRNVESASFDEVTGKWLVEARNTETNEVEEYITKFLVVATGETCDPYMPEIEGQKSFTGEILHSTQYKSGENFKGKSVLVVGCGNSGMEIALDLSDFGAKTSIVVRSPIHILSREMMYFSTKLFKYFSFSTLDYLIVLASKFWYGDLTKYGIKRPEEGPFLCKRKYRKYPVIDVGTCKKIKSGEIQVLPGMKCIQGDEVVFVDGKSHQFDVIIFATGFKSSTHKWLKDDYLLNEDGFAKQSPPNEWKGRNGLYCVGLAGRGLYSARIEAQNVANDIKTLL